MLDDVLLVARRSCREPLRNESHVSTHRFDLGPQLRFELVEPPVDGVEPLVDCVEPRVHPGEALVIAIEAFDEGLRQPRQLTDLLRRIRGFPAPVSRRSPVQGK
ncbi:MAG TPA: hypothetical protein VL326_03450 [Kofleriaceae bacterium]|nr:hypothetical protein [Kofleriaceae bacterium]